MAYLINYYNAINAVNKIIKTRLVYRPIQDLLRVSPRSIYKHTIGLNRFKHY